MLFPTAPASWCKKKWADFCCIVFLYLWAQKMSQIFKILFQTGDIMFVLRGIFFSRYVQLKSSFSDEKKHQRWNLRHTFVERSYRKLTWQSIKGKFHHWQKLELCKVIYSAKLHWKRWWGCAFNSRMCEIFSFFEFKVRPCSFFIKHIFILWR